MVSPWVAVGRGLDDPCPPAQRPEGGAQRRASWSMMHLPVGVRVRFRTNEKESRSGFVIFSPEGEDDGADADRYSTDRLCRFQDATPEAGNLEGFGISSTGELR